MDDSFEIPVLYKGVEMLFPARLLTFGYTHKFQVEVAGEEFFFEKDDNGEYRALVDPSKQEQTKKPDVELLKAVATSIESILK